MLVRIRYKDRECLCKNRSQLQPIDKDYLSPKQSSRRLAVNRPADALRMAREVPGLAYTLDYSHFHAQGFLPEEVAPLHPYAVHMHIKQALPGVPKTLWHEGSIPYAKIIGQLAGSAWQGVLSSEYIGPMPLTGPPEESRPDNPFVQNLEVIRWITTTLRRYA